MNAWEQANAARNKELQDQQYLYEHKEEMTAFEQRFPSLRFIDLKRDGGGPQPNDGSATYFHPNGQRFKKFFRLHGHDDTEESLTWKELNN